MVNIVGSLLCCWEHAFKLWAVVTIPTSAKLQFGHFTISAVLLQLLVWQGGLWISANRL